MTFLSRRIVPIMNRDHAYLGEGGEEFQHAIAVFQEGFLPFGTFAGEEAVLVTFEVGIDLGAQEVGMDGFQFGQALSERGGGLDEFCDFGVERQFGGVVGKAEQGVYSFHDGLWWVC